MSPAHTVQHCRWAQPTLYLPLPDWLEAWDAPWSCVADRPPRPIECTDECQSCPRWEARADPGIAWTIFSLGL